jgi:flagellar protein FliS
MSAMGSYRADHAYRRNSVETATPLGLIIMLYDGAITNIGRARRALAEEKWEEANRCLSKARDIVFELMGSLDFEKGGEIAGNLYRLYEYMTNRLLQAHLRRDASIASEVQGLLAQLKEAWEEAERKLQADRKARAGTIL